MTVRALTTKDGSPDLPITAAGTYVCDVVDDLDFDTLLVQARLAYGSGGTTVKAYLQTTIDQGATWVDIACFAFTTASASRLINLVRTPVTSPVTPGDGVLADNTTVDGILGERLRLKVVVAGTYGASTVLSVRALPR